MAIKYITLMDGRVIPWDDQSGQPIPASATVPGISTTLMNPMGSSNQALDDQKNVVNPSVKKYIDYINARGKEPSIL